jgi:UDP-glucose 4-epimerase
VKEIIETARAITGHAISVKTGPRRAGDPAELIAANDRIRRELGWKPQYADAREVIASAWRWHQARPKGYDTI